MSTKLVFKALPIQSANFEIKSSADGKTATIKGYASTFDNVDLDGDVIRKGAFAESIKGGGRFPMFVNHDHYAIPVGGFDSLKEDDQGLYVEGAINLGHRDGPSLKSAVENNDMPAFSIGFQIPAKGAMWIEEPEEGGPDREIVKANLKEISIVTFPANPAAKIDSVKFDLNSFPHDFESCTDRDVEHYLRDLGFSKSLAVAIATRKFKQSDSVFKPSSVLDLDSIFTIPQR